MEDKYLQVICYLFFWYRKRLLLEGTAEWGREAKLEKQPGPEGRREAPAQEQGPGIDLQKGTRRFVGRTREVGFGRRNAGSPPPGSSLSSNRAASRFQRTCLPFAPSSLARQLLTEPRSGSQAARASRSAEKGQRRFLPRPSLRGPASRSLQSCSGQIGSGDAAVPRRCSCPELGPPALGDQVRGGDQGRDGREGGRELLAAAGNLQIQFEPT